MVDANDVFTGKVPGIDIFRSLGPNYKKADPQIEQGILTAAFAMKAARDFNLWMEPTKNICERGSRLKVAKVLRMPEEIEYID